MYTKSTLLFPGLLALLLITQCRTRSDADSSVSNTAATSLQTKNFSVTKFDTLIGKLNSHSELSKSDLVDLKVFDTADVYPFPKGGNCDTTVQLNDSVLYSIVSAGDEAQLCTHFAVVSMNKKSKTVVASKYLHADCDVDFSWDTYELYEHKIILKDKILLGHTTVFQKKNRKSNDDDEAVDHKQIQKSYFIISPAGQITQQKAG